MMKIMVTTNMPMADTPNVPNVRKFFTHCNCSTQLPSAVGAHPNYLSSLFRKTEGISMYQYILDQKIRLAKNLLRYSNSTFSEIAGSLGFASQSHLGQLFRKATGLTLKQYRNRSKPREL